MSWVSSRNAGCSVLEAGIAGIAIALPPHTRHLPPLLPRSPTAADLGPRAAAVFHNAIEGLVGGLLALEGREGAGAGLLAAEFTRLIATNIDEIVQTGHVPHDAVMVRFKQRPRWAGVEGGR